jgi:lipoprotein-anchoring transpeptidase ErfK/SrfK
MRVPAFLGAALAAMALAASAAAQSPATTDAAAPADKPSVTVINPDSAAPPPAAAPEAATSAQAASEAPASSAPASPPSTPEQPAASAPAASSSTTTAAPAATDPANAAAPGAPTTDADAPKLEAAAPPPPPPEPTLFVNIDLSSQRMTVKQAGGDSYTWPISSAAYGYKTPTGTFRPTWMSKLHYSRQYDLAPMPNAIFFSRGAAIHGTQAVRQLGRPASHGCVRLAPGNAAKLFNLVNRHGKAQTKIVVHGKPRYGDREMAEGQRLRYAEQRRRYAYDYDDYSAPYYTPRGYKSRRKPPMPYYNRYGYGYGF